MPVCWEPCGGRFIESKGIAMHRAAHLRRGIEVVETLKSGTFRYSPPETPQSTDPSPGGAS